MSPTVRRCRSVLILVLALIMLGLYPPPAAHAVVDGRSSNWAGYAVHIPTTRVSAHWIVPAVDCSDPAPRLQFTDVSMWIGIGGIPNGVDRPTLAQEGIDADCDEGEAKYQAWYELETGEVGQQLLPTDRYPVRPGDRMTASITHVEDRLFHFVMKNLGDQAGDNPSWADDYREFHEFPPGTRMVLDSGEAIVERPTFHGRLGPLTNFGDFRFRRFRVNRTPANNFDAQTTRYTLMQRPARPEEGVLATTGPFLNDNGRFTVTWHNYGRNRGA